MFNKKLNDLIKNFILNMFDYILEKKKRETQFKELYCVSSLTKVPKVNLQFVSEL
jgi:hypothetical protein